MSFSGCKRRISPMVRATNIATHKRRVSPVVEVTSFASFG
jgi:hypothetical protein